MLVTGLAVAGAAQADRHEASVHGQASGGMAWVGDPGTSTRVSVPAVGLSARATYGLRHWLAVEAELGATSLGVARFRAVPITIDGGVSTLADLERTTRTARATGALTLRLGVAWIPTLTVGAGAQARQLGPGRVVGSDLAADGREAGVSADVLVLARAGLDHRVNRRLVIGVSVGASRALMAPAIDTIEATLVGSPGTELEFAL